MSRHMSIPGLVLCFLLCATQAQAAPDLLPVASFFGDAEISSPKLSPSGRYIAAVTVGPNRRTVISVIDLNDPDAKPAVISHIEADIRRFIWVNDEHLAYDLTDNQLAPGVRRYAPGLFGVKRDGTGGIQLALRQRGKGPVERRVIQTPVVLITQQFGSPGNASIYAAEPAAEPGGLPESRLLKVDPVHGGSIRVERPATVNWWTLDAAGEPRLARANEGRTDVLWYLEPGGKWRKLREDLAFGSASDPVVPLGFGPDGALYATVRNGKETTALYAIDLKSGQIENRPLVDAKGYDIDGELIMDSKKLLGARYLTDVAGTVWFDDKMTAVQRRVDELLPGTINKLTPPRYGDEPWVLVESQSDVVPTGFLLFNRKTGALTMLGSTHPQIDSRQMATMRTVHYTARDGLEIQALLTLPPGVEQKNLPLVVLAHDGPWQRGSTWGWRDESQFLASRGYAVLEPSFRGSTGLGTKLFEAGRLQWGGTMQDDLADGARWAVKQGLAADGRICIAGRGYGGYATLMGLAKDPGLYQCGVAWGAITDLSIYLAKGWNALDAIPNHYKENTLAPLVGDPVRDAERLKQASPITQASRIGAPLLLAHGEADRIVPVEHGRNFYNAVKRSNQNVEWVEYPSEFNTWELEKTRIDFWQKVEAFLDKQIGSKARKELAAAVSESKMQ